MAETSTPQKKAIDAQDLSLANNKTKAIIQSGEFSGPYHTKLQESFPTYDEAICENVMYGENNAFVILGRDRPYSLGSGKGAGGGSCGRVHLIAGLAAGSSIAKGQDSLTGPNLITDAATVYVSQRTNIDEIFGIPVGSGMSSKNRSGIGIKADHVRIIGREHVKIYAGSALAPEIEDEKNSSGGTISARGRIDLIADDYEGLQPAVKGQNLVEFIHKMLGYIQRLAGEIDGLNDRMRATSIVLAAHTHPSPGGVVLPSTILNGLNAQTLPQVILTEIRGIIDNINYKIDEFNYVKDDLPIFGSNFILSDSVYIT